MQVLQSLQEITMYAWVLMQMCLEEVQLEELHQEAERMKALGNKHMAAQGTFLPYCFFS